MIENKIKIELLLRLLFLVSLFVIIISFITINVNGSNSVVSEKATGGKYIINCLGDNNILTLYNKDENIEGGFKLIYSTKCDNTKFVYESYIDKAVKLNIVNGENENNERINYVEYFDRIYEDEINIKMDTFTDEFCFTIKLNKYVDIKILEDLEENVKDFYKCYPKELISNLDSTGVSGSVVVPVYINEQLKKEFIISKPKEPIKISFKDLGIIDKTLNDKMVITFKNPSGIGTKVNVIDSNIDCHTKTFVISDEYKLFCNQSKKINNYFVQIQDSNKNVYYDEYQRPPKPKSKSTGFNLYYLFGILAVIIIIGINVYNNKSKDKDKTALQQLKDRQNDDEK